MDFSNSIRRWKESRFAPAPRSRNPAAWLARMFALSFIAAHAFASPGISEEGEGAGEVFPTVTTLEAGADFTHFTNGYGNGNDQFMAILFTKEWSYLLRLDVGRSERFGDSGIGVGAMFTRFLTARWSVRAGINAGSGEFILPKYRLSAAIGRAFLPERNLTAEIEYVRDQSRGENYYDRIASSLIWYADSEWMWSVYFNYDIGQPGSTETLSGVVGLTWYRYRDRYIGGTIEYGDVNYIQVGPTNFLVSLTETVGRIYYTEYLDPRFGFTLRLDVGDNDFYDFTGVSFQLFREW